MKKFLFSALVAVTSLAAVASNNGPQASSHATAKAPAPYQLQPQLSTLGWLAKKVTGQHNGTVQFKEGTVLVTGNQISGGTFTVDMTSIKVEDLTDAGYNAKLLGHLRSDDFFSVEKNPTATLKITSVTPIKGAATDANNVTISGDLTIKGITKPITFPAKAGVKNGVAAASGTAMIDRSKYDVRYGSKSFFANIGDKAIDDEFAITFNVIAKK